MRFELMSQGHLEYLDILEFLGPPLNLNLQLFRKYLLINQDLIL